MTRNANYEIDIINSKIIMSKKFYKAASISVNSPEYKTLIQLRNDNPDFAFELREIKKKDGKKTYRNLTYDNMRNYIIVREGENSSILKEFDKTVKLSQSHAGSYAYVKTWFLNKYKDEFKTDTDNAEKTKAEETNAEESKANLSLVK